jgi:hypothetical protein
MRVRLGCTRSELKLGDTLKLNDCWAHQYAAFERHTLILLSRQLEQALLALPQCTIAGFAVAYNIVIVDEVSDPRKE